MAHHKLLQRQLSCYHAISRSKSPIIPLFVCCQIIRAEGNVQNHSGRVLILHENYVPRASVAHFVTQLTSAYQVYTGKSVPFRCGFLTRCSHLRVVSFFDAPPLPTFVSPLPCSFEALNEVVSSVRLNDCYNCGWVYLDLVPHISGDTPPLETLPFSKLFCHTDNVRWGVVQMRQEIVGEIGDYLFAIEGSCLQKLV